jgi:Protein of unknown function (DUF3450)
VEDSFADPGSSCRVRAPLSSAAFSVLTVLCLIAIGPSARAQSPVPEIENLTLQWTGLKHQNDQLIANWRREQPVQEQQLSLLERERTELTALLDKNELEQDQVEQRRAELLARQTELEREQMTVERELAVAILTVQELHGQLPPPLLESWDETMPRLVNEALPTTDRLQVLVDMLGQLDDFRRRVSLNQAVMTMADGRDYLVKQVYLGISHGWYVSSDGQFAAAGRAGPDGWQWQPVPAAGPISDVIAMLERRGNAELVTLPLALRAGTGTAR